MWLLGSDEIVLCTETIPRRSWTNAESLLTDSLLNIVDSRVMSHVWFLEMLVFFDVVMIESSPDICVFITVWSTSAGLPLSEDFRILRTIREDRDKADRHQF